MHYPWWYVPHLTSPMLIAFIAVVHVLVSHYAVGGGLFLFVETRHAHRTSNREYLDYLHRHARFFVLLTVVFGAITGVGIWWTIGLASPLATEVLIHTFVFGWAMEYVFFVIELAAAFLFLYFWGRVTPRTHVLFAGVYAFAAWVSLVLITGITGFMLNSGDWPGRGGFWNGFFNPQFAPQVLARTGGSLLLASMYVYFHASICSPSGALREIIGRRSARPALLGAVLIVAGGAGWFANLPESSVAALMKAPALNIFMAILFAVTVAVFAMLYFGPYRNPAWLTPGFGVLFLMFGIVAVTVGEFVREAVRKPYIVHNVVMSSNILASEIPGHRAAGFLESGPWTRALIAAKFPQVMDGTRIDERRLLDLPPPQRIEAGEILFMHHCNDCHATDTGLSAIPHVTIGWAPEMIHDVVTSPELFHHYMPPFAGTPEESQVLAEWIESVRPPFPAGMRFGPASAEGGE